MFERKSKLSKAILPLTLILMALAFCYNAWSGELSFGDRPGAEYISCYDGNTCAFTLPGVDPLLGWEVPVRLRGVLAPEIRGSCQAENQKALEARDVARATLEKAKVIVLKNVGRGQSFQIVAGVEVDGLDLATLLVESGLAVHWDGESPKPSFCAGERLPKPDSQPEESSH